MKNKKLWVSLLAGIMAAVMILTLLLQLIPVPAEAASSSEIQNQIDEMEKEQQALQDALDELESKRDANQTEIESMVQQKDIVDQQISLLYEQIDNMNDQIAAYAVMIADKQTELDKAEADLQAMKEKHLERIRALEEDGQLSYWYVLFEAEDFIDLLDRLNMVQEIAAADQKRLEEMNAAAEAVAAAKENLRAEQNELQGRRQALAAKQAELDIKSQEATQLLADLIAKGEEFDAWMEQKENDLADLEEEINDLEVEFDKAKYEEWLATSVPPTTAPSTSGGSAGGSTGNVPQSGVIYRGGTALTENTVNGITWLTPCTYNRISSTFGMRYHPVYHYDKMHKGVDLAVGHTPIYATRGGVVVISGWDDSAGNWVVIDHGDGFRSVYMHMCKRPYVKKGDFVGAGTEIGCVGTTGTSTGLHLHFGISQYNPSLGKYEYVNPLLYMKY